MTKKEIVKLISDELKESQVLTKKIVQMTFDLIVKTLVAEGRIELRNFGVFEVKLRRPRQARNPKTSEKVEVPERKVVTFQPGKIMEEEVRHARKVVEPKRKARKPGGKPAAGASQVPAGTGTPAPEPSAKPHADATKPVKPPAE